MPMPISGNLNMVNRISLEGQLIGGFYVYFVAVMMIIVTQTPIVLTLSIQKNLPGPFWHRSLQESSSPGV